MKTCATCHQVLASDHFHKKADAKDGLHPNCKACKKLKDAAWRVTNADRLRAYDRDRGKTPERRAQARADYRQHAAERIAGMKIYAQNNKALVNKLKREYKSRNPAKTLSDTRRRQARQLQAVPAWANQFYVEEVYDLARRRTEMTGRQWQVDHTVPLQSKLVCGLHCEANLRVIPAMDNRRKSNRTWPDMF